MPLEPKAATPPATPPAPAPTPTPAAAPAPTPSPSPSPEPAPTPSPFDELAARADAKIKEMDAGLRKPEPKVEPKPEPKVEPRTQEPKPKPPEAKSEPRKLRDELDARTAELTSTKENLTKLESKLKELETKGQDTSKVLARVEQLEKEMADKVSENEKLSAKLKVLRLEEDPEFQKEHDHKFNRAAQLTRDFIQKIDVLDETGTPIRKADWQRDFVKIYHQFKDSPVTGFATMKALFGDDAARLVLPKIESMVDMERVREEKLAEARARAKEMQEQEQAQIATRRQQDSQLWTVTNKDLQERNPEFKLDPTDAELNQSRDEAFRIFDGKPKDEQQGLIKRAFVRQMVGMYYPQKLQIARLNKELSEAKAELASLKNPTPQPPKRVGEDAGGKEPEEDWASRAKRELTA